MSASEDKRFSMTGLESPLIGWSCNFQPPPPPLTPFDKLPTETIEEIFSFSLQLVGICIPPSPIRLQDLQPFASNRLARSQSRMVGVRIPFPIVLCLVCKKWLDITMAHHSLWATFHVYPIANLHPRFSSQLRQYLLRSGAHSLRIQVQDGSSDQVISDILDAVIVHSERWHRIEFHFPMKYRFLQQLDAVKDRLPLLQRLHIRGPSDPYPTGTLQCAAFYSAPSLGDISLEEIDADAVRILNLPWNKVASARLDFRTRGLLLPSLQSLTTLTMYWGSGHSFTVSPKGVMLPVTLKKLQVLRVLNHSSGIENLTCPSLEELQVSDENGFTILKFLDNSSCPLTRIDLKYLFSPFIPRILQHDSLARLTFLRLSTPNLTKEILEALVLDSGQPFPMLETFILNSEFNLYYSSDFESHVDGLCKIIHSRTYPMQVGKSSLETLPSPKSNDTTGPSLKECFFDFTVDKKDWRKWQEEKLESLRAFCMSRNVLALVRRHHKYHYKHANSDDDSDDLFDSHY